MRELMMNRKKIFFVCSGSFHLFTSVYIAMNYLPKNTYKILIFSDVADKKFPINIFKEYFDKIFYQKQYNDYPSHCGIVTRMMAGGWLFPFSEYGREFYRESKDASLYIFND